VDDRFAAFDPITVGVSALTADVCTPMTPDRDAVAGSGAARCGRAMGARLSLGPHGSGVSAVRLIASA